MSDRPHPFSTEAMTDADDVQFDGETWGASINALLRGRSGMGDDERAAVVRDIQATGQTEDHALVVLSEKLGRAADPRQACNWALTEFRAAQNEAQAGAVPDYTPTKRPARYPTRPGIDAALQKLPPRLLAGVLKARARREGD